MDVGAFEYLLECCSIKISRRMGEEERMEEMNDQVILEQAPLNSVDRCDRCGAQAYVRATLISGADLLFCSHHAKAYAESLKAQARHIHDESDKLNESSDS